MLTWRLLSAAIGVPLVIVVVLLGGPIYAAVLAVALSAAVAELLVQTGMTGGDPSLLAATAATAAVVILSIVRSPWPATAFLALLTLILALRVARPGWLRGGWWLSLALSVYVGGLGRYLLLLRLLAGGRSWVLFALFTTFASDTGAYAVGRLLGRHRLAPSISPSKTVEGAVGGVLTAAVAAVLLSLPLDLRLSPTSLIGLGIGVSLAAQIGDLLESALKRRLQLKDAGSLIPGHGGLLDRLDSLLFSGAMVYCVVKWMSL